MNCETPEYDWPDCPIPEPDDQDLAYDLAGHAIASAIQHAAFNILATGPCFDIHTTQTMDETGALTQVFKGPGVTLGIPDIDPDCCGAVATGIVYPPSLDIEDDCIRVTDLEFHLKVTWCDTDVFHQSLETSMLQRLILKQLCCLLHSDYPKASFRLLGFSQNTDQKCDETVLIIKAESI